MGLNSDFSEALRTASGMRVVANFVSRKVRGLRLKGIGGESSPVSLFPIRCSGNGVQCELVKLSSPRKVREISGEDSPDSVFGKRGSL